MVQSLIAFFRDRSGVVSVETAIIVTFLLSPAMLFTAQVYDYRAAVSAVDRESYSIALQLAIGANPTVTKGNIQTLYAGNPKTAGDSVEVETYCSCQSTFVDSPNAQVCSNPAQYSAVNCLATSDLATWNKIIITRSYSPLLNLRYFDYGDVTATHVYRVQ